MKYDKSNEFQEILSVLNEDDDELQKLMEEPNGMIWDGSLITIGVIIIWWLI